MPNGFVQSITILPARLPRLLIAASAADQGVAITTTSSRLGFWRERILYRSPINSDSDEGDRVEFDIDKDRYKPDKMRAARIILVNGGDK
jgi:hypothetical protein